MKDKIIINRSDIKDIVQDMSQGEDAYSDLRETLERCLQLNAPINLVYKEGDKEQTIGGLVLRVDYRSYYTTVHDVINDMYVTLRLQDVVRVTYSGEAYHRKDAPFLAKDLTANFIVGKSYVAKEDLHLGSIQLKKGHIFVVTRIQKPITFQQVEYMQVALFKDADQVKPYATHVFSLSSYDKVISELRQGTIQEAIKVYHEPIQGKPKEILYGKYTLQQLNKFKGKQCVVYYSQTQRIVGTFKLRSKKDNELGSIWKVEIGDQTKLAATIDADQITDISSSEDAFIPGGPEGSADTFVQSEREKFAKEQLLLHTIILEAVKKGDIISVHYKGGSMIAEFRYEGSCLYRNLLASGSSQWKCVGYGINEVWTKDHIVKQFPVDEFDFKIKIIPHHNTEKDVHETPKYGIKELEPFVNKGCSIIYWSKEFPGQQLKVDAHVVAIREVPWQTAPDYALALEIIAGKPFYIAHSAIVHIEEYKGKGADGMGQPTKDDLRQALLAGGLVSVSHPDGFPIGQFTYNNTCLYYREQKSNKVDRYSSLNVEDAMRHIFLAFPYENMNFKIIPASNKE